MLATGTNNQVQGRLASGLSSYGAPQGGMSSPYPFGAMGGFSPYGMPMNGGFVGGYGSAMPSPAPSIAPSMAGSVVGGVSPSFSPYQPGGGLGGGSSAGSMYNFSMKEGSISSLGFSNFGHPLSANNSVFGDLNMRPKNGGINTGTGRAAIGMGQIPENGPSQIAPSEPSRAPGIVRPGPGMHWMIKNNKLIVSGFQAGSAGREKGVKPGDILRKVGQIDILKMVKSAQGRHPAIDLLLGPPRSSVQLTFLRVQKPHVGQAAASHPLLEFTVTLPRVYPPGMEPPRQQGGCCVS